MFSQLRVGLVVLALVSLAGCNFDGALVDWRCRSVNCDGGATGGGSGGGGGVTGGGSGGGSADAGELDAGGLDAGELDAGTLDGGSNCDPGIAIALPTTDDATACVVIALRIQCAGSAADYSVPADTTVVLNRGDSISHGRFYADGNCQTPLDPDAGLLLAAGTSGTTAGLRTRSLTSLSPMLGTYRVFATNPAGVLRPSPPMDYVLKGRLRFEWDAGTPFAVPVDAGCTMMPPLQIVGLHDDSPVETPTTEIFMAPSLNAPLSTCGDSMATFPAGTARSVHAMGVQSSASGAAQTWVLRAPSGAFVTESMDVQ